MVVAILIAGLSCSPRFTRKLAPLPEPRLVADSVRVTVLAEGVKHRYYWIARGPWAISVLDVDRAACWFPAARHSGMQARGRALTTELFRQMIPYEAIGAVNADFFSLTTGAPVGAWVHIGMVFAGPVDRPVFGIDTTGTTFIGKLELAASFVHGSDTTPVRWNRPLVRDASIVNSMWSDTTDTATGAVEIRLREAHIATPRDPNVFNYRFGAVVTEIDTSVAGVPISPGYVLVIGARTDSARRARLLTLNPGDTVHFSYRFVGRYPWEVVGGFPMLVRSGAIVHDVDSAGGASFRARNPRTAVALASGGRRMLFVTVDGRQKPYSDGMTLRELAELMRSLGADDALNLDGGGSTTMVIADSTAPAGFRIANRPSDKEGERPVSNAIVVRKGCSPKVRAGHFH